MASGKVHYQHWKKGSIPTAATAVVTGISLVYFGQDVFFVFLLTLSWLFGYFLGKFITPDLDLIGVTWSEWAAMRELKFLGLLILVWFTPYAYGMRFVGLGKKGHRNFFSHSPIISTAIRLFWLLVPAVVAWYYWRFTIYLFMWYIIGGLFIGLAISDIIHLFGDLPLTRKRK